MGIEDPTEDVVEQQRPVAHDPAEDDPADGEPDVSVMETPWDADPADAADQRREVRSDDDDPELDRG